jgi:hypothetical protein
MFLDKATLVSTITDVDDSGSDIRITAPDHGLTTGDTAFISGVGGTEEANGTYVVTRIDDSKFTLDGTTFVNAWTGGGGVYTGWRLQLSLGASDYDCHVTVSYKLISAGNVVDAKVHAAVVSTATTTLLESDPSYTYSIEEISIVSTEASGDIVATIQLVDKDQVAYKRCTATIDAGYQFVLTSQGTMSIKSPTSEDPIP